MREVDPIVLESPSQQEKLDEVRELLGKQSPFAGNQVWVDLVTGEPGSKEAEELFDSLDDQESESPFYTLEGPQQIALIYSAFQAVWMRGLRKFFLG